ncbi:hypothetical protein CGRA01v4_13534 [Colletotrichum graminicola]|nr:hypothetical protein CGRA01v4_13534 [Colletotrichum graminicola]
MPKHIPSPASHHRTSVLTGGIIGGVVAGVGVWFQLSKKKEEEEEEEEAQYRHT